MSAAVAGLAVPGDNSRFVRVGDRDVRLTAAAKNGVVLKELHAAAELVGPEVSAAEINAARVSAGTAFYRKYTEALLRRYMRTSLHMGRTPSVLGNLVFRGKSSYSGRRCFEDDVIFVHDMESCLKKLDRVGRELVGRIALQEYTQSEVAAEKSISVRSVMRRYAETLDRLTEILLEVGMLEVPGR